MLATPLMFRRYYAIMLTRRTRDRRALRRVSYAMRCAVTPPPLHATAAIVRRRRAASLLMPLRRHDLRHTPRAAAAATRRRYMPLFAAVFILWRRYALRR